MATSTIEPFVIEFAADEIFEYEQVVTIADFNFLPTKIWIGQVLHIKYKTAPE